jgi:hypothetical protein
VTRKDQGPRFLLASFNVSGELLDVDHDWIRYASVLGLGLAALALVLRQHRHR